MRVAVVGAGFAGLQAATDLRAAGHDVVVLEARDRVGGRVWSHELVAGDDRTVVERGAEFVLAGYDLLRSQVAGLGLALADMGMTYYVRQPVGGAAATTTTHEAVAAIARLVATAAAGAGPGRSVTEVVADLPADPAAMAGFLSRISVTSGRDAADLDASVVADVTTAFAARPSWRVVGGNQRIAEVMSARLGAAVRLRTAVRAVHQDGDGTRLLTDDDELHADVVVLAVPLAVLRRLEIPSVPAATRELWERTGLGHNAKLHLPLVAMAGTSAVHSVPERFWTWTATDGSGHVQPVLHCFAGTPDGLAQLAVYDGPHTWARRAAALRPDLEVDVDGALVTTWNDDPWAGMSYTATMVGTPAGDSELLGRGFGRIHVAGEHTAGDWSGLMEGALRSGRRAAAQVAGVSRSGGS